jgi:hypothetical protein
MATPTLHDNFEGTVELYSTFIKQMKADNPHMNVSEVSYSKNKQGDNNSSGKRVPLGSLMLMWMTGFMRNTSIML